MSIQSPEADARTAPSAGLSLDISRVVSQMVAGETVDTARSGAELAERYPELGISGTMIEAAIARAAGMVGMIKDAENPVAPEAAAGPAGAPEPAAEDDFGIPSRQNGHLPEMPEAEFDAFMFTPPQTHANGHGRGEPNAVAQKHPLLKAPDGARKRNPVAALRRVLFGA